MIAIPMSRKTSGKHQLFHGGAGLLPLLLVLILLLSPASLPAESQSSVQTGLQSNLAPTPPMGWANWNHFFCDYDDSTIRAQADAMVRTGMKDLGYKYLIIQECIAPSRDGSGAIVSD